MPNLPANRIAAIVAGVAGVLGALAPIIVDIDTASAAGLIAGLLAIVATVDRFLKGSQAHERHQAQANAAHRDATRGPDYAGASDAYNATQPVEDPETDDVPLEDLPSDEEEAAAPPPSEAQLDRARDARREL